MPDFEIHRISTDNVWGLSARIAYVFITVEGPNIGDLMKSSKRRMIFVARRIGSVGPERKLE